MKALVTLSSGDMRRALNILQVQTAVVAAVPSWNPAAALEGSRKEGPSSSSLLHPPLPQSTTMAFGKVTEENVYMCTGHPLKSDIANILDWMLNLDFSTAYRSILVPPPALGFNPRCYKPSCAGASRPWPAAAGVGAPCWGGRVVVGVRSGTLQEKAWKKSLHSLSSQKSRS